MTREEAIKQLKDASDSEVRYGDIDNRYDEVMKRVEAFEMAIKALEQEPCEDAISRESLDNAISGLTYWHFENGRLITGGGGSKAETVYKVDDVMRLTHVLPSVAPQYTDAKIQKMQELEQAEIQKAYELGKTEAGQWIPVSERLPEDSGRYIVSALDGTDRRTTVAPYQPRCKAWTMTGRMAYWRVVAWMPLPEPYKESDQNDDIEAMLEHLWNDVADEESEVEE